MFVEGEEQRKMLLANVAIYFQLGLFSVIITHLVL